MNVPEKVWVTVGTLRKLGEYVPPGIAQKLLDVSTEWEQFCSAVQGEQDGMDDAFLIMEHAFSDIDAALDEHAKVMKKFIDDAKKERDAD